MLNGTSLAEAMLNSEKIKPVVLAVIELHLSEGIGQSVIQAVSQSVCKKKKLFHNYNKKL